MFRRSFGRTTTFRTEFTSRFRLFLVLIALSVLVIVLDRAELLRPVESLISRLTDPVTHATHQLGVNLAQFGAFTTDLSNLRTENERLRQELEAAKGESTKAADLARQLAALQAQLDFQTKDGSRFQLLSGDVLNYDPSNQSQIIVINKGSDDRVERGQVVLDPGGALIGKVVKVESRKATVMMITDNGMAVNVSNQRLDPTTRKQVSLKEQADGVAAGQWQSGGRVKMIRIKPTADIQVNDFLFTNGLGASYPADILVGSVLEVKAESGQPDKLAIVRPIADLEHLQRVQIILAVNQ